MTIDGQPDNFEVAYEFLHGKVWSKYDTGGKLAVLEDECPLPSMD